MLALHVAGVGGVAPNATAVTLNVTVTEPATPGYLTVFPCGQTPPTASNLNFATGQTIPNLVIARIGQGGNICDLGRSGGCDLAQDQSRPHFRVSGGPEINVIARMAPMIGIQKPLLAQSGLAKPVVTP